MRNAYSKREPSKTNIDYSEIPSLTVQEQAKSTDINNIMARFRKTGVIEHLNQNKARYIELSQLDYHTIQNQKLEVERVFSELPSATRQAFQNDPQNFLDYLATQDYASDMSDGVIDDIKQASEAVEPQRASTDEAATESKTE